MREVLGSSLTVGFSFKGEKGVGFIPKAKVRVLHTAQLDVTVTTAPEALQESNSKEEIVEKSLVNEFGRDMSQETLMNQSWRLSLFVSYWGETGQNR
nr:hypothetical protein [Tanacetum cinerariifolium]